jgi:hypothetical protein
MRTSVSDCRTIAIYEYTAEEPRAEGQADVKLDYYRQRSGLGLFQLTDRLGTALALGIP